MKPQKKNKFYTFLLSFIPGAAEMYMGFMKKGISLMTVFVLSIIIPSVLHVGDVFILVPVLFWTYSFFHARNLAACEDVIFVELKDEFVWESFLEGREIQVSNPTLRKWAAGTLIVCGVVLLWNQIENILYPLIPNHWWGTIAPLISEIPQVAIAILIIVIGVRMIKGKKEELDGE